MNALAKKQAFNAAAEKFIQHQEKVPKIDQEGFTLFMEMLRHAPDRLQRTIMLGAGRDGLLPVVVTKPPAGKTYWDWTFSADDFYERLQESEGKDGFDLKLKNFQDACQSEGVRQPPVAPRYPTVKPDPEAAQQEAWNLFLKLQGKGPAS